MDVDAGTKKACLAHIDEVWTDMRPKSLRDEMSTWPESEKFHGIDKDMLAKIEASRSASAANQFRAAQPPNALVQSLLQEQSVKLRRYRKRGTDAPEISLLKQAIELGLVLVTFTGTKVSFAVCRRPTRRFLCLTQLRH
jgi:hypothetical protein